VLKAAAPSPPLTLSQTTSAKPRSHHLRQPKRTPVWANSGQSQPSSTAKATVSDCGQAQRQNVAQFGSSTVRAAGTVDAMPCLAFWWAIAFSRDNHVALRYFARRSASISVIIASVICCHVMLLEYFKATADIASSVLLSTSVR
jgi:hypothetical protein